ncbi:MAG: hypothetical protein IKS99_06885 [Firmicutes bacterium]|nr:hypothetical protein [Bacillota bacterium]
METVNQEKTVNEDKTFTQEEVNQMIGERLARERAKFSNYEELEAKAHKFDEIEEKSKTELQKATEKANALQAELDGLKKANSVRELREKVAKEKQIPAHLLTADTEDELNAQADAILSFAKPNAYPAVKDGGEVKGQAKGSTREQFAEWMKQIGG